MHAAVGKLLAVPCFTVTGQLSEAAMRWPQRLIRRKIFEWRIFCWHLRSSSFRIPVCCWRLKITSLLVHHYCNGAHGQVNRYTLLECLSNCLQEIQCSCFQMTCRYPTDYTFIRSWPSCGFTCTRSLVHLQVGLPVHNST
jgi:hypothetical protein